MSFADYVKHGWAVCLIPPGGKRPLTRGWQMRENAITDPSVAASLPGAGLLHAWSGTCAIDIDNLDVASVWLAEQFISVHRLLSDPASVRIASGRAGRAKLLYRLATPLQSVATAPFKQLSAKSGKEETYTALDFRCATKEGLSKQDVLPGTLHPDTGKPYVWTYGDDLFGSWRNLPELPAELRAVWESLLTASTPDSGPAAPLGADFAEIRALLAQHDPNAERAEWLRVGMAVHHETQGSRDGLLLWNEWSAQASGPGKYQGLRDLETVWRSFSASAAGGVTLGSLRAEAVATLDEFGLVPASTEAPAPGAGIITDLSPDAIIRDLLGERVIYITTQGKWFFIPGAVPIDNLDEHANVGMDDRQLNILFEPHMPFITREGKNGAKTERPIPSQVMRTSKNKRIVNSIGFHPGEKRVYTDNGQSMLNSYHERRPIELLRPKSDELDMVNYLFGLITEEVMRTWLLKFYGHMIQKPGIKIKSGPLLYSHETGTGKGTLMKELPSALFGPEWVIPLTESVLSSRFNEVLVNHWVVHLEEMHAGESKKERRQNGDKLKAWFTERTVLVEPKGLGAYKMPNRFQLTAASNAIEAAQVDNHDRRLAIGSVNETPIPPKEQVEIYSFLLGERGTGVLREIFKNQVDITGFNPNGRAPDTKAKRVVIQAGLGTWESHLVETMTASEGPFVRDIFTLRQVHEFFGGRGPATVHTLKNILRMAPFHCEPMPNCINVRYWAWRNVRFWARATDGIRRRHIETGEWPMGTSNAIPPAILAMSADGGLDEVPTPAQDHRDLLGV